MVMYGNGNIPEDDVLEMVGKEVIEIREKRKEDEENYNLCAPILEDIKTDHPQHQTWNGWYGGGTIEYKISGRVNSRPTLYDFSDEDDLYVISDDSDDSVDSDDSDDMSHDEYDFDENTFIHKLKRSRIISFGTILNIETINKIFKEKKEINIYDFGITSTFKSIPDQFKINKKEPGRSLLSKLYYLRIDCEAFLRLLFSDCLIQVDDRYSIPVDFRDYNGFSKCDIDEEYSKKYSFREECCFEMKGWIYEMKYGKRPTIEKYKKGYIKVKTKMINGKLYDMKFLEENVPLFILADNDAKEYWFLNQKRGKIGDVTKKSNDKHKWIVDKYEIRDRCSLPIHEGFEYKEYNELIKNSIDKELTGFQCLNNKEEELIVF